MRLSRKPSAVRRRRAFFAVVLLLVAGAAAGMFLVRPDPAKAYAESIGFETAAKPERARIILPADLTQPPFGSYLSASRAAGYDFAALAGQEIVHVTFSVGRLSGTEQQVFLNVYLSGRKVVGAFLTGADSSEAATPVNSPALMLEPLG